MCKCICECVIYKWLFLLPCTYLAASLWELYESQHACTWLNSCSDYCKDFVFFYVFEQSCCSTQVQSSFDVVVVVLSPFLCSCRFECSSVVIVHKCVNKNFKYALFLYTRTFYYTVFFEFHIFFFVFMLKCGCGFVIQSVSLTNEYPYILLHFQMSTLHETNCIRCQKLMQISNNLHKCCSAYS